MRLREDGDGSRRFAICIACSRYVCRLAAPSVLAQDKSGCDDLFRQRIENVNLLSSALVPAQGDLPAYCRVLGVVRPAINFEVRFPASNWNGKFYMAGCGGFCGTLDSDRPGFVNAMNFGLRRNYAVSTMDSAIGVPARPTVAGPSTTALPKSIGAGAP